MSDNTINNQLEPFFSWFGDYIVGKHTLVYRDNIVISVSGYLVALGLLLLFFWYLPTCGLHFLIQGKTQNKVINNCFYVIRFVGGFFAILLLGASIGFITLFTTWGRWYIGFLSMSVFWLIFWTHGIRKI